MNGEIAILMAAGLGMRMRPLTDTVPKPLVCVNGIPMIETLIEGLLRREVRQIYIVTGYLKKQFSYLQKKYKNITLIENKEYLEKNNISSLYAVGEVLGSADCFICEADLYVADLDIFRKMGEQEYSCYFGKYVKNYSSDWVFEIENKRIKKIKIGGSDLYNMTGISYWKKADADKIKEAIRKIYLKPGHEKLFWDEVVNDELEKIAVSVNEVPCSSILEIDTVEELKKVEELLR